MKRFKINMLTLALLAGVTSAFAKAGPWDSCAVDTRGELDLLCPPGNPICCRFYSYTWLRDTNETFPGGTLYPGTYTPL
ncbi:hypothetical protein [Longitalea luteola]|uniref:hypothetical protein n=1 Tax=Longitalea luteola TaxID=2812563 RepID=UPI001A96E37A|nr:hypothetical protein [Longitalea luteola]